MTAHRARLGGFVACVVDSDPRFGLEAVRWYASASRLAGIPGDALVVNMIGDDNSRLAAYLRSQHVTVQSIERFDARSPHCNKIAGALRVDLMGHGGPLVLTDTDVAMFADPRSVAVPPDTIGMRPVDEANPPIEVLREIFAAADLPEPDVGPTGWIRDAYTLAGNGNGGLYVIPAEVKAPLTRAWARWASWLLDRRHLLSAWTIHVDQVAMALALQHEGIKVIDLGPSWNVPTHAVAIPQDLPRPEMVHYHGAVRWNGSIAMTQSPEVDAVIAAANRATAEVLKEAGGLTKLRLLATARRLRNSLQDRGRRWVR